MNASTPHAIAEACNSVLEIDDAKLIKEEHGNSSLNTEAPLFRSCKALAEVIRDAMWMHGTSEQLNALAKEIRSVAEALRFVAQLDLSRASDVMAKDQRLNELRRSYSSLLLFAAPLLFINQTLTFGIEAELKEHADAAKRKIQKKIADVESIAGQAKTHLDQVQELTRDLGISRQANHFLKASKSYNQAAFLWIASTALIGAALLFGAILLFCTEPAHNYFELIHDMVPRLILFSAGFTALVFAMRNYSAARHNEALNDHRAVSLSTFQAFLADPKMDAKVRSEILLEAARCAFSQQTTGFLKEPDAPQITQLTDLGKRFSS